MKIRSLGLVFTFLAAVLTVTAQKTVTNADLERYRAERVQAEERLRQDYERKGTSIDEVMRHNKASQKEMIELSAKLRADRLEEEKLAAERAAVEQAAAASRQAAAPQLLYQDPYYWGGGYDGFGYGGYGYGYGYGNGFRGRRGFRFPYLQQGYYAGGQFWPTSPSTPSRPAFRVPRPSVTPHRGRGR